MRALLLMVVVLMGCIGSGDSGNGGSQYCCTVREFCVACGCSDAELTVVEAGNESACQQVLDTSDLRCALADEVSALAQCVSESGPSGDAPAASGCVESGDGCRCREGRFDGDVPFQGTCDEEGVGEVGLCCKGNDFCYCDPVQCGITEDGMCVCGAQERFVRLVDSCDGFANSCCTGDTGDCFCEDNCERYFGVRPVSSCNIYTPTAVCADVLTTVSSCE